MLADGGMGPHQALPPAPPLLGLGEDPAPEDLGPRAEPARAIKLIHAGQTLRSVTAYGLDPFSNFVSLFGHVSTGSHPLKSAIPAFVWTKQAVNTSAVKECPGARTCGEVA